MADSTSAATLENLERLAAKPGVQSTLILSKKDGSIIKATGLLDQTGAPDDDVPTAGLSNGGSGEAVEYDGQNKTPSKRKTAEDVAKMVFAFVDRANTFADGMSEGDEVKLLRMRTKKNEMMIVPDSKYLLVVVHDTPPA